MRISYFPGCTLHSKARSFDASARAAALALDIVMDELPEWTCCGATFSMPADSAMGLVAPTRILASVKEAGKLLTLCSFCYNTLKRTNHVILNDAERRRKVMTFLDEDYQGNVRTVHLLEILRDDIGFEALKGRVTKRLGGLKVAPYYGCLLLRPAAEVGFDDPERPTILEKFLASLGCEVIDFPHKTECCGSFVTVSTPETARSCAWPILEAAGRQGAEMLVVSCPLCQYNLDRAQRDVPAGHRRPAELPVLYFSQLLALALGCEESCLHLDGLAVDPRPRLSRWLNQSAPATAPA
ncbi:MAG TPA: CoB--CoM heterodisulfide reductase iron-sulfur subunit B family protein [Candidatus Sulfotelmatobacter sp.]|nr:CoB--CoM heterodisulfide reductase iron-sulfur subunit B family protein [Candidatus Sulfotelmatobacter sp.]